MQRELLIDFIKRSPYNLGIDYLVVGEGENALLQLMKENPLSEIPNLVYWDGGEILFSNNFGFKEEFEKIPAPFYNSKETPQLQSSRTCYYNRCLFCAYKKFPPNNSIKSSSQIFSEIKTLKKRFDNQENAYPIYFADSCLSIDFLENFSRLVISDNVDISLTSYLRFEENLDYNVLKLAREAGFGTGAGVIRFGLETSSERLLEVVNKGTVLKNAERIIDDCYKLGINIIVSFLLNLPTQTYDEFLQDLSYIDYLLSNYDNIHVRVNMFCLENYSYFLLNKDKYGIIMIDNNYDFKYSFDYRYEGKNVIKTRSEAINIFLKFYYNLDIKKRVKISLNS
jgi:radical SAM superfamily enzyme YgiQ (UPF0313 family)